ncbi:Eco57I restriction-modification methylase domain-containing protein [Paracoccus spongiarum]|uniref:site-specific DNA-methyltransferase (adenine-specific) n=1 Tax=Paracoccus spongiarum TaxID=3064387 RepID=A0ABT9JF87_9RHOB|nr:Eco57I restriction-modification methylase domain-containing protein [Paracoccus sp. 2205BS29-5]MDP5308404.1 Eco57I restriction-modification methylase domain-containing protein [Paracoccus sp. 2205BS29-5]
MNDQVGFSFRGRNPDVLTCIANLSNDEVFTPPEFANRMLDTLTEAWAADHGGADLWADSTVRFLDPCTKSGVFLREITRRLIDGLAGEIPDLQARVDHILTRQVFGIGITQLTSLLARRSLYCSKHANGAHSIACSFTTDAGNVWFERTEHVWVNGKCRYCGASNKTMDRGADRESHAYTFIHTDNIKSRISEIFGGHMQFDVIIGNPPYQLSDGGHGVSASPIYQEFVEQAKTLEPRYLSMIIPSRWFGGGKGLGDFRATMLADSRLRKLVDFENAKDAFPGVDLAGGVCYFLWNRDERGLCEVTNIVGSSSESTTERRLDEFSTFVRHSGAVPIIRKVLQENEPTMSLQVSSRKPFGLATNARPEETGDLVLRWEKGEGPFPRNKITVGSEIIDKWKVITSYVAYDHAGNPGKDGKRKVFSKIEVLPPGEICTETYLVIGAYGSRAEAENLIMYMRSKFFRFLVAQFMYSHHLTKSAYNFVPILDMTTLWTDEALAQRYQLTLEEREFIGSKIRSID